MVDNAGTPSRIGMVIALHLLYVLPTLPVNLSYHTVVATLTGSMLELYANQPWPCTRVIDTTHMPLPNKQLYGSSCAEGRDCQASNQENFNISSEGAHNSGFCTPKSRPFG